MPQAGWYDAPGEPGLARFWNGTAWTTHRQPMPRSAQEPAQLPAPAIPAAPPATTTTAAPAPLTTTAAAAEATEPRRRRFIGLPVAAMAVCLLLVLLGVGVIVFVGNTGTAAAGETSTRGTVTALGWKAVTDSSGVTKDDCYPSASFVANGSTHTARASTGETPCPVNIGDSATVVYSSSSPDDARIALPPEWLTYAWLFPAAAGFGLVASLIAFILRMRAFAPAASHT